MPSPFAAQGTLVGSITGLRVFGNGPNSAQVEVTLDYANTFVVPAYPEAEPQVFAGIAALLSGAYFNGERVEITWETTGASTRRAVGVRVPAAAVPRGANRKKK